MSDLRGPVDARPWGATLAVLALARQTAQLTVRADGGAVHRLAFAGGAIVGATSPVAADALARIALASRLVTRAQVDAFAKTQRAQRDELDAFIAAMALAPAQAQELRRRVLVQRAARTFAIDRGTFAIEDRMTIPTGLAVDARAVVYHGARLVLHGDRLAKELRELGTQFTLTADAAELAKFDFGADEQPVIEALRDGASIPEIEARRRDLDPRMVQAVVYALATCQAATVRAEKPAPAPVVRLAPTEEVACVPMLIRSDPTVEQPRPPAVRPRGTAAPQVTESRAGRLALPLPSPDPPPPQARPSVAAPRPPVVATAHTVRRDPRGGARSELARGTRHWTEPFLEARPTTLRPNALSAHELRALIAAGARMLEQSVDHFTMLGVAIGASVEAVRGAYVELARNLKPERLVELEIRDQEFHARALLAQITIAYTVLTDPARRAEYIAGLRRANGAAVIDFAGLAAEAFERGARALRSDEPEIAVAELRTACELAPDNIDYLATLASAEYSVAALKNRA